MSGYYETRYSFDEGRAKVWRAIAEYLQQYVDADSDCVLDVGAGYCDFVNNIRARTRQAVDLDANVARFAAPGVVFHQAGVDNLGVIDTASVDVLFASNLLEHLDDAQLSQAIAEFKRVMRPGACAMFMQPNFRYAFREYFDDYTHRRVFTDQSLRDIFEASGFETIAMHPRFLPFSLKSRLPKAISLPSSISIRRCVRWQSKCCSLPANHGVPHQCERVLGRARPDLAANPPPAETEPEARHLVVFPARAPPHTPIALAGAALGEIALEPSPGARVNPCAPHVSPTWNVAALRPSLHVARPARCLIVNRNHPAIPLRNAQYPYARPAETALARPPASAG